MRRWFACISFIILFLCSVTAAENIAIDTSSESNEVSTEAVSSSSSSTLKEKVVTANLRGYVGYGYNSTWSHYANLEFMADMTIRKYFELDAALQLSTANIYAASVNLRTLFDLPVGQLYLEAFMPYKAIVRNEMYEFTPSFNIGYRMDYVNVRLGAYYRTLESFHRNWHSEDEIVVEPYGLLYDLEVFVRPQTCKWNLSLQIANTDNFQIERVWQPMFMVKGRYSPVQNLYILLEAQLKITGMFHLDASFYDAKVKAGISYQL